MNALTYLLQVNLYLLLFYLFYLVLLRYETFFRLNRFYLVGSGILALFIPLLRADWIKELFVTEQIKQLAQIVNTPIPQIDNITYTVIKAQEQPLLTSIEWFWLVYGLVTLVFLINFLRKLYLLNKVLKKGNKGRAFSFFNKIFVDNELEGQETIMKHELVHAKQWHSADVIFFELFTAMNWFNPVTYLYKNAIKNIHEFIADETAASTLENKSAYALLLVSNAFDTQPEQLTNSFYNQSLLKRRIIMLHKTKSRKVAILKYGLSVPLFAGMVIFSSASGAEAKIINKITEKVVPVIANYPNADLKSRGYLKRKTEPIYASKVKNSKKKSNISLIMESGSLSQDVPINLSDYAHNFKDEGGTQNFKEGMIFISFEVNERKKPGNFKISKSDNFEWQDDYLTYLNKFNDTVSLTKGTYHFYKGYIYAGNEEKYPSDKELLNGKTKMLFGGYIKQMPTFITHDETKEEAGKIVNYLTKTPLTDPIVFVDGKKATYKKTKMGFKLDEPIYPRGLKSIRVFKDDKAVAEYNESARKGLIVIVTKDTN
ncbi:M56 family metallopeptidase [Pedobacter sp. V48]|uniref:M56 family metallopeptidase n=1 Tax=Pedobacter sp. V48 TaxID=509635 RepID=UPI0003E54A79|nr:M56 family metallopeptidase [Pedobacter sp. V48]ETZ20783.1 hypothetical protein N824_04120 [Pedobacter sp. V48]